MSKIKYFILSSSTGLGVYIPSMLVYEDLKRSHNLSELFVLENLYKDFQKERIKIHRDAFQKNFSVALTAQRLAGSQKTKLDKCLVEDLYRKWDSEDECVFLVFSGFWMDILEKYRMRKRFEKWRASIIHLDADVSLSWKKAEYNKSMYKEVWLFNKNENSINYQLPINDKEYLPFEKRNNRFVLHGGGWGIGTYKSVLNDLRKNSIYCDLIINKLNEYEEEAEHDRFFIGNTDWFPWMKDKNGDYCFPPLYQVVKNKYQLISENNNHHKLYDLIIKSKGIISKPGGGTLIDSFNSATPLIFLEPFGEYEKKNGELWESLGFGISYDKWKCSGFSRDILYDLYMNLLKKKVKTKVYKGDYYAAQN